MSNWGTRKKPIYETRVEVHLPQDHIRPYGERMDVHSEANRNLIRKKLLGVQYFIIDNCLYNLRSKEYMSRSFYKIEKVQGLENKFNVIDKISSEEYDSTEVENPMFDYWSFRIDERGQIISTIFSSYLNKEILLEGVNTLSDDYLKLRDLRIEELHQEYKRVLKK